MISLLIFLMLLCLLVLFVKFAVFAGKVAVIIAICYLVSFIFKKAKGE